MRLVGLALTVLVQAPGLALPAAGAMPSQGWTTMPVPGGSAALRCVAQLPADIPRAELLIALSRRVALNTLPETILEDLAQYARWLDEFDERAAKADATKGVSLRDVANRRRLRDLLEHAGFKVRERKAVITVEPSGDRDGQRAFFRARCEIR